VTTSSTALRDRPVPAPAAAARSPEDPVDRRFTALVPPPYRPVLGGSGHPLERAVQVGRFGPAEVHVMPAGDRAAVDRLPSAVTVSVILPLTGWIDVRHLHRSFTAVPTRSIAVLSPGSPFLLRWPAHTSSLALCVDIAALTERLEALLPERHRSGPLRFTPHVVGAAHRDVVAGTVQLLAQAAGASGRLTRLLGSQALDTLLLALPHSHSAALAEPTTTASGAAVRDTVDRIVAEQAAHYTVGELAELAAVSLRTLQAGFRAEYGCTPQQYLRRSRLAKAHADLEAADPAGEMTVGDIAARWGFYHLGRFAASFRERFGETPSEVLRRS